MKKAAVAALILLLVVSLGTSVFLLIGQNKATADLATAKKKAEGSGEVPKEIQDKLTENNKKLDSAIKAKEKSEERELELKTAADKAKRESRDLQSKVVSATTAEDTLKKTNTDLQAQLEVVQNENLKSKDQLSAFAAQITDKDKQLMELEAAKNKLKDLAAFNELKMTPEETLSLKKKRPLDLKTAAIPISVPKAPGKLKKPLTFLPAKSSPKPAPQPNGKK